MLGELEQRYGSDAVSIVNHWYDQVYEEFPQIGTNKEVFYELYAQGKLKFFTIDLTGIFAYIIHDNFRSKTSMTELLFFIKPCYRGSLKLVNKYLRRAERIAKSLGCESIMIGDTIQAKNEKYINLLMRHGFKHHTLEKKLEE